VREIASALITGEVGLDVVDWIRRREKEPDSAFYTGVAPPLSYDQCRRRVRQAEALIAETVRDDRKQLLAVHMARREVLYGLAYGKGDVRTALMVLQDMAKLLGLYPKDEGVGGGQITVNVFERVAILQQQLQHGDGQPTVIGMDAGVPQGIISGDGGREPLDQTHADAQTVRVPAAG
jgi:hypothetical protein